jgi:hypothetical protein
LKLGIRLITLLFLLVAAFPAAYSQDNETVIRPLQLSAFFGGGGTLTGVGGGKNLDMTLGADLMLGNLTYHGFLPGIEVRGSYPFYDGTVDNEENFLAGLKVERHYGKLHPYVDLEFGRGEINYTGDHGKGALNPAGTILYQKTNSNIGALGVGFDYDVLTSFAFKADLQFEDYTTVPVAPTGSSVAKAVRIGVVYRFGYRDSRPY